MSVKEFWKTCNIKDTIFNVAAAWDDIQVSNLKNGCNKQWPEVNDSELDKTENVFVDEVVQLCNNVPNAEDIMPPEVRVVEM